MGRLARVAGLAALVALPAIGSVAWAPPAAAQDAGPCQIVAVTGADISPDDVAAAHDSQHALHFHEHDVVVVSGNGGDNPIHVDIGAFGLSFRAYEGAAGAGDLQVDIHRIARWGTGRYRVDVSGGCSARIWIVIDGATAAKPVFFGAGAVAALGLVLAGAGLLRARH